jgi:hypothetical protein
MAKKCCWTRRQLTAYRKTRAEERKEEAEREKKILAATQDSSDEVDRVMTVEA